MMLFMKIVGALVGLLLLAACASAAGITPAPRAMATAGPIATARPSVTTTAIPSATAVRFPTSMPAPTAMATRQPPASTTQRPAVTATRLPATATAQLPSHPTPSRTVGPNLGMTCDKCIKGNISSKGEKIYHLPGCNSYGQTVIDEKKGERWFSSEAEARAAGWRIAENCR